MSKRKYKLYKTCIKCKKDTVIEYEKHADYVYDHRDYWEKFNHLKYVCWSCQKEIDKMVECGSGI